MTNSILPTAEQGQSTAAPAPEPALVDDRGVASILTCSTRTVRRMADSGAMPRPVRVLTLVRWRRDEILTWIADGCPSCRPARRSK